MSRLIAFQDPEERPPTPQSPGPVAVFPGSRGLLSSKPFLDGVVRPIYEFLAHQILARRNQPIAQRVMYDDVNEFFWSRRALASLMDQKLHGNREGGDPRPLYSYSSKQEILNAYSKLLTVLRVASEHEGGAATYLSRYFHKTYREVRHAEYRPHIVRCPRLK